jgi:hypothetical protein
MTKAATRPGLRLVGGPRIQPVASRPRNEQTVATLRQLLREAERGDLVGFACTTLYQDRTWDYGSHGECDRNKTWTVGMLAALQARLIDIVNDS